MGGIGSLRINRLRSAIFYYKEQIIEMMPDHKTSVLPCARFKRYAKPYIHIHVTGYWQKYRNATHGTPYKGIVAVPEQYCV